MISKDVHIIAGPTASGKSARALALARELGGVIINADSLQIYDGLSILTAQPSVQEMQDIPHRLYGVLSPQMTMSAMDWRAMALAEIDAALGIGKVPIVVGGTGFYLKTLVSGLSPIPEIPNEVRVLSDDLMDKIGIEDFFLQLKEIDPVIAEKIDPSNRQRLVRAYEVFIHTGKPMSYWQSLPPVNVRGDLNFITEIIMPDREILYERCNLRFDMMMSDGALQQVRDFDDKIMAGHIPFDCALSNALGFKHLQEHVRGEIDLNTAVILSKNETRHYAKRQVTWFKHQMLNNQPAP